MRKPSRNDVVAVVDDDPGVLQAVSDALELYGLRCILYPNGEALLAQLHPRQPLLVSEAVAGFPVVHHLVGAILDLNLPGVTGLEVARQMHRRLPSLPIAIVTALQPQQFESFGRWPAGVTYLRKPFDLDALEAALPLLTASRDEPSSVPPTEPTAAVAAP